jgi:hypothetical protein
MSRLLSSSRIEELDSITDAWELLQELERHPQMRVRAAYYSRLIVLAANQSSAQQQMLTYDAHRVFHVQHHTIRLDLERSRLLAQLESWACPASGSGSGRRRS